MEHISRVLADPKSGLSIVDAMKAADNAAKSLGPRFEPGRGQQSRGRHPRHRRGQIRGRQPEEPGLAVQRGRRGQDQPGQEKPGRPGKDPRGRRGQ